MYIRYIYICIYILNTYIRYMYIRYAKANVYFSYLNNNKILNSNFFIW